MKNSLNYIKINDYISTSGQVTKKQLIDIQKDGFEVIINLALCSAKNALENEDKIVTDLNMIYIHLPVNFKNPKLNDLRYFIKILQVFENKKVWIHCAKNYRVTAFMYVYHKYILRTPFDNIDLSLLNEWNPNKNWQKLMKSNFEDLIS